jgi:hypothetical protein
MTGRLVRDGALGTAAVDSAMQVRPPTFEGYPARRASFHDGRDEVDGFEDKLARKMAHNELLAKCNYQRFQ